MSPEPTSVLSSGAGRFAMSHQTIEFLSLVGLPNVLEATSDSGTNRQAAGSRPPFARGRGGRQEPPQPQRGVPVKRQTPESKYSCLFSLY